MSHPAWGAWIETVVSPTVAMPLPSHPAWGAWIETAPVTIPLMSAQVAPRVGCVD